MYEKLLFDLQKVMLFYLFIIDFYLSDGTHITKFNHYPVVKID